MNKEIRTIELLTKKGKSFKNQRFHKVTEYFFCPEIWNQIKEYLIVFNPRFHFYAYSFAQSIFEDEDEDDNFDSIIRTVTFNVFDFTKFNENSKYHLILQNIQDITGNNLIIDYPSKLEFVCKESNELNLQLGFISYKTLSNDEYLSPVINTDDIDFGLDALNTDNKLKWDFIKWKADIKDGVDYRILDRFLELNGETDKLPVVENYLRELLNEKYKIRKIFKTKNTF